MNNSTSFIFVNRGGKNLADAIKNIETVYPEYIKEIIIIEQDDNLPFLRGQLFNIGVKYATGEFIALSDNDMFHLRKVPWIYIYNRCNRRPLIGFKYISQVTLTNGVAHVTSTTPCLTGFGGFNFMATRDFVSFNGFSNLFIGWGFEDNAYSLRFNYLRVPNTMGHITHPIRNYQFPKNREYNMQLLQTAATRDAAEDGMRQTQFSVTDETVCNKTTRIIKVTNITVPENFKYKRELQHHYDLLKEVQI